MEEYKVYKFRVETTTPMEDTFLVNGKYFKCEDGYIYVLTKSLVDAINKIGEENVIRIESKGIGYLID